MRVSGKVVLVTGAASGMGRELVLELLRRGARVAGVDVNAARLADTVRLAEKMGAPSNALATFPVDITDRVAVEALPTAVEAALGPVDAILNCAGIIQPFVPVAELDLATIERVFSVNWWGTVYVTRAFLPRLLARPEAHVLNVSSMGGFVPVPGQTIYGASKAAVKLFTEGLRAELRGTRVHVTIVFPGAVATDIVTNSGVALRPGAEAQAGLMLTADRAARQMLDGMERDAFRVLVGLDAKLLDLAVRAAPAGATAFLADRMKFLIEKKPS